MINTKLQGLPGAEIRESMNGTEDVINTKPRGLTKPEHRESSERQLQFQNPSVSNIRERALVSNHLLNNDGNVLTSAAGRTESVCRPTTLSIHNPMSPEHSTTKAYKTKPNFNAHMSELDEGFATDFASAELFRTCVTHATNEPFTEPKRTLNTSDDENIYATVKKMFHKVDEYKPTEEPFKGEASAEDDMLYTVQVQYAET